MARRISDPIGHVINNVHIDEETDCWLWAKPSHRDGYARARLNQKYQLVHRFMWKYAYDQPVPEGLELDHLCRNKACVNPAHLEPVTHLENVRRGTAGQWEAKKTHCTRGHPYEGEHLRVNARSGKRACRTCEGARLRRARAI